jgi:predicted DNA-binding ArsR family transcriptional regulator
MKNIIPVIGLLIVLWGCVDSRKKKEAPKSYLDKEKPLTELNLTEIELSKSYSGETTVHGSVSNVKGVLVISLSDDSKVYKLAFMSNGKISKNAVKYFKVNVEKDFNIRLDTNAIKKDHYYKYANNLYYSFIADSIAQDHYAISFSITDRELQKANKLTTSQ